MVVISFILEIIGWIIIDFILISGFIIFGVVASSLLTALFNFFFNKETWSNFLKRS